ncbi:LPP20 lipoprotein [Idiomarina fontislapidosi]|uniref:LPP20 lipoprotein n=1 Tax=Idiomarina fontislapidosi TaxID=263723 RepID=A0A432YAP4_9GAMM|nr:LPP20 family lipoprotein [Idiomarina fontislapidosi]PYE35153.1 LPP20 lipoprotein [Idiomarina fontislapidosi]RUO58048.1 hypothetical protein CWE25_00150 [Idiomarina fontislapidosi]|tara:strand:+ start:9150 stop:9761 length:612 start_codon:yes stop_codon:yes gene_type:complete
MKKTLLVLSVTGLLAACSSQPQQPTEQQMQQQAQQQTNRDVQKVTGNVNDTAPGWVFNPQSDKGLAASSCVDWSGNMAVDKPQAIAAARADLTQQIQVKASVLDKLYNRKVQAEDGSSVGATFEQVSKQVASETLVGSTPEEMSMARIDGKKYLCALVVLDETRDTFDAIIDASKRTIDPQSKEALYEEFRAQKAMKELEAEL